MRGKGNFSNAYGMMNLDSEELLIEFSFEIFGSEGLEEYMCRVHAKRNKKDSFDVKPKREVFIKDQGEWIPSEITKGEDILGISYNDFRKTIVLQQQDFLGFISAEPKENTETLMRLFQLERFDLFYSVDNILKSESSEFQNVKIRLDELQYIDEQKINDIQKLEEELQNTVITKKQKLDETQHQLAKLKQILEQQQQVKEAQRRFAELEQSHDVFKKAKERLNIAPIIEWDNDIVKMKQNINTLTEEIDSFKEQYENTTTLIEKISQQGKETQQQLQILEELQKNKQSEREQKLMSNIGQELVKCETQKKELERMSNESSDYSQKIEIIQQKLSDKEELVHLFDDLQIQESKLRDLQGLATAVKHLEENCPCPLCGSEDHPHPYQVGDSSDELDSLSQKIKELQTQLAQLSQEESLLKEYQNKFDELQKNIEIYPSLEEIQNQYQDLLLKKQDEDNAINILKKELDNIQNEYQECSKKLEELRNSRSKLSTEQGILKTKLENNDTQIQKETLLLEISEKDRNNYINDFFIDMDNFSTIKNYPQKTQQEVDRFFEEYLVKSGEVNQNIIMDDVSDELVVVEDIFNTLSEEYSAIQQQLGAYKNEIQNLQNTFTQKQKLELKFHTLSTRKDNLDFLKKLFKGSGFVHFIGQKYLSKLCYTANNRFLRFTQNQFELSAPDEFDDKKGRIMVIDRLSGGNKRDMMTLSGGQSFQAALSLALALADESGAGHRFFFVDEGFGTLDQDSLLIVLDSLRELVTLENRVVGVISHIPLMKEEVNAYMQVSLDKSKGTVIEFHE